MTVCGDFGVNCEEVVEAVAVYIAERGWAKWDGELEKWCTGGIEAAANAFGDKTTEVGVGAFGTDVVVDWVGDTLVTEDGM